MLLIYYNLVRTPVNVMSVFWTFQSHETFQIEKLAKQLLFMTFILTLLNLRITRLFKPPHFANSETGQTTAASRIAHNKEQTPFWKDQ